jgi:hypothetical protein
MRGAAEARRASQQGLVIFGTDAPCERGSFF